MDNEKGYKIETEPVTYLDAVSVQGVAVGPIPEELKDRTVILKKKSGYVIADFDGTGMLEIQKTDDMGIYWTDKEAVNQAIKDGIKIIPIDELPENFPRRYLGWIDTPDNRKAIEDYCIQNMVAGRPQHKFEIQTPMGTVRAAESLDEDNPGIALFFLDKNGTEKSSCLLEYRESEGQMMLAVWTPNDPEGDASYELKMN